MRALVRDILELEDYEVVEAADGPSALEQVEEQTPDLMVLDIMMPGMSGLDVLRELRRERSGNELPDHPADGGVGRRHHLGGLDGRRIGVPAQTVRPEPPARLGRPPDRLPEDARSEAAPPDILKEFWRSQRRAQ